MNQPTTRSVRIVRALPGWIATGAMICATTLWTYWGINELYHEGWWGAWTNRLAYLVPIVVTLLPTLLALRWPIFGGCLILVIGVTCAWFFGSGVFVIALSIALIGGLFILHGVLHRRSVDHSPASPTWWRRNVRYIVATGLPLFVLVAVSAQRLPVVLTRFDDGDRGARLIEGNGVTLIWAPEGPGWNWKQPWGGYPSWQRIALYGVNPVGLADKVGYGRQEDGWVFAAENDMEATCLCRYLSEDGTVLMDEPQDAWRMPTTDELVRSLVRDGANAGAIWTGAVGRFVPSDRPPDKESPLWAPDQSVIYYWSAESYDEDEALFVSYNGMVNVTRKTSGNPRHGYRCVKEPGASIPQI